MRIKQTMCLSFGWALFIIATKCNGYLIRVPYNQPFNDDQLKIAVSNLRDRAAVNCTGYIPEEWKQLMLEHHPSFLYKNFVPNEYLLACLNAQFPLVKNSPPFSLVSRPEISYNVGFNQVVSLGFDGILTIKALHFQF